MDNDVKLIHFTNNAAIVEGHSLGGILLDTPPIRLKEWFFSHSNHMAQCQIKTTNHFNLLLSIQAHAIEIEIDFFAQAIRSIKARPGYQGQWRIFRLGAFTLLDLLRFDWTFEHMSRGLILSEHYKGVGFVVPDHFEDEVHFLAGVLSTHEMAQTKNFLIDEMIIFPEFLGKERLWDVYEPFIWEEWLSVSRRENQRLFNP